MAVVQQTPYIVHGDIRANLVYGYAGSAEGRNEDPTQEEIEAACKRTNAYKVIMEQPERWRTDCSDLSPGQKQIITITRALLRNPRILILDEITASLDADTQELVATAIETLMEGRTTVQIAHRLVVLQNSDHIICLEDGVVAQSGDHKSLMAMKDGMYRRMVLKQNLNTGSGSDEDDEDGEDSDSDGESGGSDSESDAADGNNDESKADDAGGANEPPVGAAAAAVAAAGGKEEEDAEQTVVAGAVSIPGAQQAEQPLSQLSQLEAVRAGKDLSPPKQRWVTAIKWAMTGGVSTAAGGCDQIETNELLLELSVLKRDLSGALALKDDKAIAEFQANGLSLVERASTLVQRVSREQARLEQLARQVERPPTTVISPSAAAASAAAAAAADGGSASSQSSQPSSEEEEEHDAGLGLSRQLSRTRSRSSSGAVG